MQLLGHYEEPVGGNNTQCYEISTRDDLKEYEQCTRTEWDENLIRECDGDQDVVISRNRSDSKVAAAFTRLLGRLNLYNVMDKSSDDDVDEILLSEILSRSGASRLTFNRSLGGGTSIETVFERQPSGRRQVSRRDDSSSLVLEAFARLVERAAATELVLDLTIDIRCFALRERARLLDAIERGELLRDFNRNLHGDLAASLTGIGNAMYKSGRPQAATVAFRGAFIAKSRSI